MYGIYYVWSGGFPVSVGEYADREAAEERAAELAAFWGRSGFFVGWDDEPATEITP